MNQFKQAFTKFASRVNATAGEQPPVPSGGGAAVFALTGLALAGYGTYHSMITVQPGHAGIVYNRWEGIDETTKLKEGLNFVVPWLQRAIIFDCRTKPQSIDTQSGSKGIAIHFIRQLFQYD